MEVLIPKKTGTYADALCAIGYASLIYELRGQAARIEDIEYAYRVSSPKGAAPENWKVPSPGYVYIWRQSAEARPAGTGVLDYEAEKGIADIARKSKASARARRNVTDALEEVSDAVAVVGDPEYRFAAIIEQMRKGWSSDLTLHHWIRQHGAECLEVSRARLQGLAAAFDVEWSNSQLLNPSTGKGIHSAKTISKSAGSFKLLDPFEEWMKLRGMWAGMLAFRSGSDFKFFVIVPGNIEFSQLKNLRLELRDLGMWGIVRLEIEAVLRLLLQLMRHCEFKENEGIRIAFQRPRDVICGLHLALFKSLGTAAALMNDSLLTLPGWFDIKDSDDADAYIEICEEPFGPDKGKFGPLSALRDDRSDDIELLQKYRRWLNSGLLMDLLEFHTSFGVQLLRKMAAGDFAPSFQTSILHRLITKGYSSVKEIIESKGFLNIARAIRNTTIYAVGMKNNKREIRFGFAQKLKQRIKAGDREFLSELSDFVQQQNWEIVHRLEGKGFQVSESDLNDIVRLTDDHGAELVGMLLLAYGFSRAEATSSKESETASATSEA